MIDDVRNEQNMVELHDGETIDLNGWKTPGDLRDHDLARQALGAFLRYRKNAVEPRDVGALHTALRAYQRAEDTRRRIRTAVDSVRALGTEEERSVIDPTPHVFEAVAQAGPSASVVRAFFALDAAATITSQAIVHVIKISNGDVAQALSDIVEITKDVADDFDEWLEAKNESDV